MIAPPPSTHTLPDVDTESVIALLNPSYPYNNNEGFGGMKEVKVVENGGRRSSGEESKEGTGGYEYEDNSSDDYIEFSASSNALGFQSPPPPPPPQPQHPVISRQPTTRIRSARFGGDDFRLSSSGSIMSHLPRWPPCQPKGAGRTNSQRSKGNVNSDEPSTSGNEDLGGSNPTTPKFKAGDGILSPPCMSWGGERRELGELKIPKEEEWGRGNDLDDGVIGAAGDQNNDGELISSDFQRPSTPLGMPSHLTSFVQSSLNLSLINPENKLGRRLVFDEYTGEVLGEGVVGLEDGKIEEEDNGGVGGGNSSKGKGKKGRKKERVRGGEKEVRVEVGGGKVEDKNRKLKQRGTIGGGVLRVRVKCKENEVEVRKEGEEGIESEDEKDEGRGKVRKGKDENRRRVIIKKSSSGGSSMGGSLGEEQERKDALLNGLDECSLPRKMNGYGKVDNVYKASCKVGSGEGIENKAPKGKAKVGVKGAKKIVGGKGKVPETGKSVGTGKRTGKSTGKSAAKNAGKTTDRVKRWEEVRKSRNNWAFGKRMGL